LDNLINIKAGDFIVNDLLEAVIDVKNDDVNASRSLILPLTLFLDLFHQVDSNQS